MFKKRIFSKKTRRATEWIIKTLEKETNNEKGKYIK